MSNVMAVVVVVVVDSAGLFENYLLVRFKDPNLEAVSAFIKKRQLQYPPPPKGHPWAGLDGIQ